jgi:D-lactate dehydrogenase
MMKPQTTVAFFDAKPYDRIYFDAANEKFGFNINYFETRLSAATVGLAANAAVLCAFVNDKIDGEVIAALEKKHLRLIALRCAGYNNIDLKAVWQKIRVARVPAYSPYAIAEHAAALLLALTRHLPQAYNRAREGNFLLNGLTGRDLHGKTLGVVGTGKIGKIAADIFRGFGMKIIAFDKFPDEKWAAASGAAYVGIDDLCRQSDVITLHSPLTPETYHLVNAEKLALMKKDVVLINTGRGALIDAAALVEALKNQRLGGAGLDVYEEEEDYFFEDNSLQAIKDDVLARLLTFPNVIITGHQAFFTAEALSAIAQTTLENIRQFLADGALPNEICYKCGASECPRPQTGKCF